MNILIAIDSLKGSLSSMEAGQAIAEGINEVSPASHVNVLPLADGGEGTVEALVTATNGKFVTTTVTGPLYEKIEATYGILGDQQTAVIEIAAACGLPLLPIEKRNPYVTTSYGVGELILDAIGRGCRKFVVGLGGSATNDAGVGMLQALGFHFLDKHGDEVGFGGLALNNIAHIDSSDAEPKLKECTFRIACDVNNPLYGPTGASYIFGPQKGATPEMVEKLDKSLQHFAQVVKKQQGIDLQQIPGSGAAGGLGAAFASFLNGSLQSGIEIVLEIIQLEATLDQVDLVFTGEGKLDGQTAMGKAPLGVAKAAKKHNIPVIALGGGVTKEAVNLHEYGVTSLFPIVSGPMSLEEAMNSKTTFYHLKTTASQIMRLIQAFS